MNRIIRLLLVMTAVMAVTGRASDVPKKGGTEVRVAAAADLAFAFKEMGELFEKQTGTKVTVIYGSTGLLTKQIQEGAPFDMLAAANVSFADQAVASGACYADTKALYARGRITTWASPKSDIPPPKDFADIASPRFKKIAIANPEHAPYGKAAKEALLSAGLWEKLQKRIVYGENIKQTLQFAETGNADVAVVALSLAIVTPGPEILIEESLHKPIDQALVVCKNGIGENGARKFAVFVNSEQGRQVMQKFGFLLPGEKLAETN